MPCAICGHERIEDAHVKPRDTFRSDQDDRALNIIPLCANHHEDFDHGLIGIHQSKEGFLLYHCGSIVFWQSRTNIHNLRDEYIMEKNRLCGIQLRLRLGLVPGAEYLKIDP